MALIVGSWFSDLAYYNEFVESGVQKLSSDKATACFGDEKHTESGGPTSQGEGTPRLRTGMRQPLSVTQEPPSSLWASLFLGLPFLPGRPPFFVRSLLLYILLFCLSSSYTCQSSMPIVKCMSHQPFFLVLRELLWPPSHCPGVTSILMVSGCQL